MNLIDEGFLISKNRYSENSLIAELYTKDHGKISGIIFGGTSKKIKNYLITIILYIPNIFSALSNDVWFG